MIGNQKIKFDTGVIIDLTNSSITAKDNKGWNISLKNSDVGGFSYQIINHRTLTSIGLATRLFLLGLFFQILIPILFVKNGWSGFAFTGTTQDIFFTWLATSILVVCWALAVIIFFSTMIGSFTDSGFINRIMDYFFSKKLFSIKIGNKSGIDTIFYALPTEEAKIKRLEQQIIILKSQSTKVNNTHSNLDEIKKLSDLYKNGIITEMEFKLKKTELLKS